MLPYASVQDAESVIGLTSAETFWLNYSATKSNYFLYCHNILFLFIVITLVPLFYVFIGLLFDKYVTAYKIQLKVKVSFADNLNCYFDVMRMFILVVGPLQLVSYPWIKMIGIRTSLPLPSLMEITSQLITLWLYIALRQSNSGYDFPSIPNFIPFYGGPDFQDYHNYVFTYCDYIYGTDNDYHYQKDMTMKDLLIDDFLNFLNTASSAELRKVSGIADVRVKKIKELRKKSGKPFKSLDDLDDIPIPQPQVIKTIQSYIAYLFK